MAREAKPEDHILYSFGMTGVWLVMFVVAFILELVLHRKEKDLVLCFPGPWLDNLRAKAIADLVAKGVEESDAFLSHGDVLLAYWSKIALGVQNFRASKPVQIMNVANLRGVVPDELSSSSKEAFLGNASVVTSTLSTIEEVQTIPVSDLALRIRESLKKQRTPNQIRSLISWRRREKPGGGTVLLGHWNQVIFTWSNWHRARFYDMDFSSALIKTGDQSSSRLVKPGRPSYLFSTGHTRNLSTRNIGTLFGKDAAGNWWVGCKLRAECWPRIRKILDQEALGMNK